VSTTVPLILFLSQAAEVLGMSEPQLYELTRSRAQKRMAIPLPHFFVGRRLGFTRAALEAWVAKLQQNGGAK